MPEYSSQWIERAKNLLDYCPQTGVFTWRVSHSVGVSKVFHGEIAGFINSSGQWRAKIQVKRRYISLGLHSSVDKAHAAYMNAARQYFGEFARAE